MTPSRESSTLTLEEERAMLVEYVLERLDDLKGDLRTLWESIDPPFGPVREFSLPEGGESALEAIADAIFAAERRWQR